MSLIISVSGLRGVVGETLSDDVVEKYVAAFETFLPPGPVVVGHDGRATGPRFAQLVGETLSRHGRHVYACGPCATPTMGVLVQSLGAAGGVQVSASHNPPQYNGLKLFGQDGRVLPATQGAMVREVFLGSQPLSSTSELGKVEQLRETANEHVRRILPLVDVKRIRAQRFKVLLDSNHGAGSVVGRGILEELGCDVLLLGGEPDGAFAHPPEPTRDNLASVCRHVVGGGRAVGFCQDPDADRLALIDERGNYVGEEYTLALAADHWLSSHAGSVVTNCSTSRMTQDLANKYGVEFRRSAVGEANVVDEMLACQAVIGGEGNGGVIHPQVVLVRDSMVSMALVLDAMAANDLPLSSLVDRLPRYAMWKDKVPLLSAQVEPALEALEQHFVEASFDRLDGLRLDWPDRWLLVRASNTEPIVRVVAEAPTEDQARELCDAAAEVMLRASGAS